MSEPELPTIPHKIECGLNVEQLSIGLRKMGEASLDTSAFWDENVIAFRETLLIAIRETSDALLSPTISLTWRLSLESQLESLVQYVELADRYVARRHLSLERLESGLPAPRRGRRQTSAQAGRTCGGQ